jgi:hypothetical protein
MSTAKASLLAEVVACRYLVEDYTKRLEDACVEYYESRRINLPNLSRAEDENTEQQCVRTLTHLASIMPDAMTRWQSIKYPIDQYDVQLERLRDVWIRRRNLLRIVENTLRTNLEDRSGNKETELKVLQDIRTLLHDLTLVFITYVPDNQRKLALHNALEDLSEKIWKFPKDAQGFADSSTTVEYQGHDLSYVDLIREKDEVRGELETLIKKASGR